MSNKPKISIIIPVYNAERYLSRCLDSLIHQTLKSLEIILIDDLSTDGSKEIISAYVAKYHFIRYKKSESKGHAGGARNWGLDLAQGEYIGFVDSDDWVDASFYEKMLEAATNEQGDIVISGVLTEYDAPTPAIVRYKYEKKYVINQQEALTLLATQKQKGLSISAIVCNKLYRAEFLKENRLRFIPNNFNDDDAFNFLAFLRASTVVIIPDVQYHYYQRAGSVMHSFSGCYLDQFIEAFEAIRRDPYLKKPTPELLKLYYAYLEKTLGSFLTVLEEMEPDPEKQNLVMYRLFQQFDRIGKSNEALTYFGLHRILGFLRQQEQGRP